MNTGRTGSVSTSRSASSRESFESSSNDSGLGLNESVSQNSSCDKTLRKRKANFEASGIKKLTRAHCVSIPSYMSKHSRRPPHDLDGPPFDWQSTKQSLKDRTAYVFEKKLFCDVEFIVGQGPLAQRIPAHKFILSMASAVFEAMFSRDWSPDLYEIEVPDVEPAAFSALLRYLYLDDVSITGDIVMALLYAAKKYALPCVRTKCLNFLLKNLCPENAFELLSQARSFDEQDLVTACLEKIDIYAVESFSSDCFTAVDLDVLCWVLERNTLRIREAELFEAICCWCKAELTRQNLPETLENQCSVLERVLPLIRYPLMTSEEVSLVVTPTRFLTSDQLVSLYSYLSVTPKPPISFNCTPRGPKNFIRANRLKPASFKTFPWSYAEGFANGIGYAKEDNAKPLTYQEKKKLSVEVSKLSGNDLEQLGLFLQSREASLRNSSLDGFVFDIETLKPSTLRALEAVVFCLRKKPKS